MDRRSRKTKYKSHSGLKKVWFPMKAHWYEQIRSGAKRVELRAASDHWIKRIDGAALAVFTLSFLAPRL